MDFLVLFFENIENLDKAGFAALAIWIIGFQWFYIFFINKSFNKKVEELIQVEKDIIKEFAVTNHAIQQIAESNATMNERFYNFLMTKWK